MVQYAFKLAQLYENTLTGSVDLYVTNIHLMLELQPDVSYMIACFRIVIN